MACDHFYARHAQQVLDWVRRFGGRYVSPEDVAHDVFIVAFKRLHTLRPDGKPIAWLYGITRNVVNNAKRRGKLRHMVGLDRIVPPVSDRPDGHVLAERQQERRIVLETLQTLKAAQREILILVDMDERSAPEVAEMLGLATGTVYSRLHHARKAFLIAYPRTVANWQTKQRRLG
jgi:RNA polymerase sigma-70 factor (ECF subfamily)